jgi:chemotaxis protein methyltransferase CheR
LNNTSAMDVIFCRNVLMYFTAQRAKQVTSNFYRALVDGGWMIVSPVEASNSLLSSFTPVEFPGAVLYRKMANAESQMQNLKSRVSEHQVPQSFRETEAAPPWLPATQTEPVVVAADIHVAQADQLPAPQPDEREVPSRMARSCANQGRLSEALEWCEKAIAADKLNPLHHYLSATILQEQGQHDIAIPSLIRALYLEPMFVLAHFALGNLHQSQGRYREAQRYFGNVLLLLRRHPQDEILPEADGLTAGRLVEIVTSVLASLPQAEAESA